MNIDLYLFNILLGNVHVFYTLFIYIIQKCLILNK